MADDLLLKSVKQLYSDCIKVAIDPVLRRLDKLEQHMQRFHQDAEDEKVGISQLEERVERLSKEAADSRASQQQQLQHCVRNLTQKVDSQEEVLQKLQTHTKQHDKEVMELQQRVMDLDKEAADADKCRREFHDLVQKLYDETEVGKMARQEGWEIVATLEQEVVELQNQWRKLLERQDHSSPARRGVSGGNGRPTSVVVPKPRPKFPPLTDEVSNHQQSRLTRESEEVRARTARPNFHAENVNGFSSGNMPSKRQRCGIDPGASRERGAAKDQDQVLTDVCGRNASARSAFGPHPQRRP